MGTRNSKGLVLHDSNPFKDEVERMLRSKDIDSMGNVSEATVTITVKKTYLPKYYTKLYQNKELLQDLDPWTCKILIYIALNLEYEQERIKLTPALCEMDQRKFSKTIVELLSRRILIKEKREWYWVFPALLLVGTLIKPDNDEMAQQ